MIYITGDVHRSHDIAKLNTRNWPEQKTLARDDYLIVCGDMGIVWDGGPSDKYWQDWFEDKPFTTLFVDGNHENHVLLQEYPVEEWNGGKVHKIRPHVYHLMRGQVFDIDGLKVFTMGGASSHDKEWRIEGKSWWAEELPSEVEYAEAERNLEANDWEVDLVVSHCAPSSIAHELTEVTKNYDKLNHRNSKKDDIHLNKHAMHLIRLYMMCLDILEKGDIITYREEDRDFLLSIRNGKFQKEDRTYRSEFFDMVNEYEKKLKYAKENTALPKHPDMKQVEEFVMDCNERVVRGEI